MLVAEIKGKIPSRLQIYEDVLTSSVIGCYQYLSSPIYIQNVIEKSVSLEYDYLTFHAPIKKAHYKFWPKLENSEPDVLLSLLDENGNEYLICIEAKYYSDKSSHEDESVEIIKRMNNQRDQLAREIEDINRESCIQLMNIDKEKLVHTIMIYLTNDTYLPNEEMLDSKKHVQGIEFSKSQLYWLSWREFHNGLSRIKEFKTMQDAKLLSDLIRLLEKKGLQSFSGFQHDIRNVSSIYSEEANEFSWSDIKEFGF